MLSRTFTHPCDFISIGDRSTSECGSIISCPANEHHTCSLNVSFRSEVILMFPWDDFHLFVWMIDGAMIHLVDVFTFDEFIGIGRISTVHLDGVVRWNTWGDEEENEGYRTMKLNKDYGSIYHRDLLDWPLDRLHWAYSLRRLLSLLNCVFLLDHDRWLSFCLCSRMMLEEEEILRFQNKIPV